MNFGNHIQIYKILLPLLKNKQNMSLSVGLITHNEDEKLSRTLNAVRAMNFRTPKVTKGFRRL
jgi:hypothetical protein